ncbi:acyl-CoA thioesterase [Geotalea toluenoxydans]|uniref:acyl-CoA thioesterase n=1 Tax=Geotalea toluenoxydans TaxID=421624 RepID=UPI001FB1D59A|nr:hypothetical protein [Geotalea toluenoxydans]
MKLTRNESAVNFHETLIKVRFNEVDAYRVAWHGHYVAWMEIGRNDLAERFDVGVEQISDAGFMRRWWISASNTKDLPASARSCGYARE